MSTFQVQREMSPNQAANFLNHDLLHIHAVIAVRPGDGEAFRRPLLVAGSAHQLRRFGEVKVEPFDPGKGSLENMIEYCSKGANLIGPHHCSNCYELLPRQRTVSTSDFSCPWRSKILVGAENLAI